MPRCWGARRVTALGIDSLRARLLPVGGERAGVDLLRAPPSIHGYAGERREPGASRAFSHAPPSQPHPRATGVMNSRSADCTGVNIAFAKEALNRAAPRIGMAEPKGVRSEASPRFRAIWHDYEERLAPVSTRTPLEAGGAPSSLILAEMDEKTQRIPSRNRRTAVALLGDGHRDVSQWAAREGRHLRRRHTPDAFASSRKA